MSEPRKESSAGSGTVSVVVPTYNRAGFIAESLESILDQTYRDIEVIVVDDASTDDTEREVLGLGDDRVRYVRHDENRGPSAARNTGIRTAAGEFVAFLDSDDRWVPDKLEAQVARFSEDSGVECVYSGWEWVREDGEPRVTRCPDPRSGLIDRKPRWFYNIVQDFMVRTELAKRCLFDERIRAYENLEWLIRLSGESRWGFVPRVLVRCQDHESHRASDSEPEKLRGLEYVLSHYEPILEDHVGAHYHLRLTAGALALKDGNPSAREHLSSAVKLHPLSARAWGRLLMTWVPSPGRSATREAS